MYGQVEFTESRRLGNGNRLSGLGHFPLMDLQRQVWETLQRLKDDLAGNQYHFFP